MVPLPTLAFNANCAAKTPDDSVDHRKSETAARPIGAEERIKDPGLDFRRHAAARVGDFQLHIIARG